jgi:hypothetical protein
MKAGRHFLNHSSPAQLALALAPVNLFLAMLAAMSVGIAHSAEISARQEDEKTIRVVVPGTFELTFTKRKGFVGTFFDLSHDPQKKHDLAPVLDENGLLWTKTAGQAVTSGDSWYANPPATMELLEAGPVRIRIRLAGPHHRYGYTDAKAAWNDLGFALRHSQCQKCPNSSAFCRIACLRRGLGKEADFQPGER